MKTLEIEGFTLVPNDGAFQEYAENHFRSDEVNPREFPCFVKVDFDGNENPFFAYLYLAELQQMVGALEMARVLEEFSTD